MVGRFKKILKLATIREVPNAIKYGRIVADNVPNQYGPRKGTSYAYLLYDTQVDGKDVTLKITIRKSRQKKMFWVHGLEAIKRVSGDPAGTNNSDETGYKTTDNESVSQETDFVNPFPENSSDEVHSYSDDSVLSLDPAEILREIFSKNPQFEGYGEYTRQLQTYRDLQRTADRNQAKIENYDKEAEKLVGNSDYVKQIRQKNRRLAEINADLAGNRIGLIFQKI